jgi:putative inorganic carbon (hco3(-)) transporter
MYWVILGYVALLILRPQEYVPALQGVPILFVWLALALLLCAFSPRRVSSAPQFPYLVAFVILGPLTVGLAGWWGGVPIAFQGLATAGSLFVLAATAFRSRIELRGAFIVLVAAGVVMTLHGHLQMRDGVGWTGLPLINQRITYAGIFNDPNDLGQLLVIGMAASICLFNTANRLGKLVIAAAFASLAYGIVLTDSRGALLAALVVVLCAFAHRYGRIVATTAITLAVPALLVTTRLAALTPKEESAGDRIDAWYAGIQMWLSNPLWGVGMGGFTDHHHLTAHNMVMLPMAETGLLGFVPWLGFVMLTGLMALHLWFQDREGRPGAALDELENEASRSVALIALAFAVTGFFLSRSYSPLLFLIGGLVAGRQVGVLDAAGKAAVPWPPLPSFPVVFMATAATMVGLWQLVKLLIWWGA